MSIRLNGATSGSIEIDVPADVGSDLSIELPSTGGGQFIVSDSAGDVNIGSFDASSTTTQGLKIDSNGALFNQRTNGISTLFGGYLQNSQTSRIGADGSAYFLDNVGIGTNSVTAFSDYTTVQIDSGSSGSALRFLDTGDTAGTDDFVIYKNSSGAHLRSFADPIIFYGNSSEHARFDSNGNFGLGSNNPYHHVDYGSMTLDGTTGGQIRWRTGGTEQGLIYNDGSNFVIYSFGSTPIKFYTNGADRMTVGTDGSVRMTEVYYDVVTGSVRDLYINTNGNVGYITSTLASKGDVVELADVDWLYSLNPCSFKYRTQDKDGNFTDDLYDEKEYGLIAEEVEPVAPELCFYDVAEDNLELRGVQYRKLVAPMLKALQQQNERIKELEARLAALEGGTTE